MIAARPLDQLLADNPIAVVQAAIAAQLRTLLPGVTIVLHPGKVDLSELVAKSVVAAPGIGLGWSRVRKAAIVDGSFGALVDWTAYVVAEARVVGNRRVEKEAVGLAIGQQLLQILADEDAPFWGRSGLLPPDDKPGPELKPFFTIRDAAQGTAYYVVTWSQIIADIGATYMPTATGRTNPEHGTIDYESAADIEDIAHFLPVRREDDDA